LFPLAPPRDRAETEGVVVEEETIDDEPPCQTLVLIVCASFCCQQGLGLVTAVYRGGTQRKRIRQPPIPQVPRHARDGPDVGGGGPTPNWQTLGLRPIKRVQGGLPFGGGRAGRGGGVMCEVFLPGGGGGLAAGSRRGRADSE
jgi:hypothetical protein